MFKFLRDIEEINQNTKEIVGQLIILNEVMKEFSNKLPFIMKDLLNISTLSGEINSKLLSANSSITTISNQLSQVLDKLSKIDDLLVKFDKMNKNLVEINETLKSIEKKLPRF